jgi:hypothetical protein
MKKKNDFSAISINRIVAERFRFYSKTVSRSHTETLELMMDFFEGARISPKNKYLMNYMGYNHRLNKRFDYIEELLRQWERNSTFPKLHKTLKKLFEEADPSEQEKIDDLEFQLKLLKDEKTNCISRYQYEELKRSGREDRQQILAILEKLQWVKPAFGKPYFKLELEPGELDRLKLKYRKAE